MNENLLEQEIAELNREIAAKRAELEAKQGIFSERGALHEVVAEKLETNETLSDVESEADAASLRQELQGVTTANQTTSTSPKGSYLASLSSDQSSEINRLINLIPEKGIKVAISEAKKLNPFLLDAFHDALVDNLYQELVGRGLVKDN